MLHLGTFEELAVSQGGKLLAQLHILRVAVVVTPAIGVFGLAKFCAQIVFGLEHGDGVGSIYTASAFVFAHLHLGTVCFIIVGTPWVWFAFV